MVSDAADIADDAARDAAVAPRKHNQLPPARRRFGTPHRIGWVFLPAALAMLPLAESLAVHPTFPRVPLIPLPLAEIVLMAAVAGLFLLAWPAAAMAFAALAVAATTLVLNVVAMVSPQAVEGVAHWLDRKEATPSTAWSRSAWQVAFLAGLLALAAIVTWLTQRYGGTVVIAVLMLTVLAVVRPASRPVARWAAVVTAVSLFAACSRDQILLQPIVWQLVLLLSLSLLGDRRFVRWAMRLAVSVYLFSAVSKLDVAFFEGLGLVLAGGLFDALGLGANAAQKQAVAVAMPCFEFAAGLLLWFPRTRFYGVLAATAMHAGLLLALGPWGLDHYRGVLVWNAFSLGHVWVLFLGNPEPLATRSQWQRRHGRFPSWLAAIVVLSPVLEVFGLQDHWPAWSVYSARPTRVTLEVRPPTPVWHPQLRAADFEGWQRFDLEAWVFAERGQPPYPQERYKVALAAAVVAQFPPQTDVRVTLRRPDLWRRGSEEARTVLIESPEALATAVDRLAHCPYLPGGLVTRTGRRGRRSRELAWVPVASRWPTK